MCVLGVGNSAWLDDPCHLCQEELLLLFFPLPLQVNLSWGGWWRIAWVLKIKVKLVCISGCPVTDTVRDGSASTEGATQASSAPGNQWKERRLQIFCSIVSFLLAFLPSLKLCPCSEPDICKNQVPSHLVNFHKMHPWQFVNLCRYRPLISWS